MTTARSAGLSLVLFLAGCVTTPEPKIICDTQMFNEWKAETDGANPGMEILTKEIEGEGKTTILGHYNNSPPQSNIPDDESTAVKIVYVDGRPGVVLVIVRHGCIVTLQQYHLQEIYQLLIKPVGVEIKKEKQGLSV